MRKCKEVQTTLLPEIFTAMTVSLSQNLHSRVCCMHFKSRNNDHSSFRVHPTYVTSSCTQGPSRPGFYEAKCSSKIQLFCNSVDFLLFDHRRMRRFLELLTLPHGVQPMNQTPRNSASWHLHSFRTLLLAAASKPKLEC